MDRSILFSRNSFNPPSWAEPILLHRSLYPSTRLNLGRFPTPLQRISLPGCEDSLLDIYVKRDDLSSFDLSGNKVRKLEFILADCLEKGHDSVITIGGIQSNHARATAVAAKQLGLDVHLILRTPNFEGDLGLVGNLLFDRLVGSTIHTVTPSTYAQIGSESLCQQLSEQLQLQGKNPYVIPVGGSNAVGALGYIDAIQEIIDHGIQFDHIVFACGSGGTATGLALGVRLAGLRDTQVHAVGVCDSPEYFYHHIEEVCEEMKVDMRTLGPVRDWLHVYPGQGVGYARSTDEELAYLLKVSSSTGVIFDPVYSGKAVYYFATKLVKERPDVFRPGHKVLVVHTGGTVGMYAKESQLVPLLPPNQVAKLKFEKRSQERGNEGGADATNAPPPSPPLDSTPSSGSSGDDSSSCNAVRIDASV